MKFLLKLLLNKFIIISTALIISISSCSLFESKPTGYKSICNMLDDKISWYKSLKIIEKQYEVNMSLILAFIKQESNFDAYAKPPHKKFLGIPFGRVSSSYGYSQAKDKTWEWYRQDSGNTSHDRDDFADAAEFIAWYVNKTKKLNNVSKTNVYQQYLAYHEGHGGFKNKSYNAKPWLIKVAKKVAITAQKYKNNLATCRKKLDNTYSWSFF